MNAEHSVTVEPVRGFDPDAPSVVPVPPGSSAQAELAVRRTALAGLRTGMSQKRTRIAQRNGELADRRTALAMLRSHLSNERTHLAYVRTAIGLMVFGITLNRFAIYLLQSQQITSITHRTLPALEDTKWIGFGMVVLGIATLLWSIFRYQRTSSDIEHNRYHSDWRAVLAMTLVLLCIGAVTTVWLFAS
jgi:putative membrane protein